MNAPPAEAAQALLLELSTAYIVTKALSATTAAGLFDLPHVADAAAVALAQAGFADRCQAVGGDFFAGVPAGGDVYLLSWILHDWPDEQAARILRNCRRAMDGSGRVVVIETLLPPGDQPHFGKVLDVAMLAFTGGRERSVEEYAELFQASGLTLSQVIRTSSPMSVIEAVSA